MDLILSPTPGFGPDDYVVKHGGRVIGRIYHTTSTPAQSEWFWSLLIETQPADCHGRVPSLDAAKAAFRERWDRATEAEKASVR